MGAKRDTFIRCQVGSLVKGISCKNLVCRDCDKCGGNVYTKGSLVAHLCKLHTKAYHGIDKGGSGAPGSQERRIHEILNHRLNLQKKTKGHQQKKRKGSW